MIGLLFMMASVMELEPKSVRLGEVDPMTCWFQSWDGSEVLTWSEYPAADGIRICIEVRLGTHYGWDTPWYRIGCVASDATEFDPAEYLRREGMTPPVVKFRAVATREFVDPECESLPHYCVEEAVSTPSNEVCGGRYLP